MIFPGAKRPDSGQFGASKRLDLLIWELLGGPKVHKRVSDAYPVNLGQLNHYIVFGTKSGAVQDFQSGQNVPYRGQTDPP